jgi:hypothetical protein
VFSYARVEDVSWWLEVRTAYLMSIQDFPTPELPMRSNLNR